MIAEPKTVDDVALSPKLAAEGCNSDDDRTETFFFDGSTTNSEQSQEDVKR